MAELIQIHNPVNTAGKPRIVFIHGLDGDVRSTWMSNSKIDATLWPKWLGEDAQCPVWLLGYGATMSRWKGDSMALPRQATAVLECLATKPVLMDGPLVLVGHSLGGLVIKTILKQGMGRDVVRHKSLVQNIKGIAFVGTPHFGSRLASIASSLHIIRTNPQVSDLAMDNAYLEELNQLFVKLQQELGIKVRVYSETRPMRLTGAFRWLPFGATVVSPSSSQPHIPGEAGTPVEADHLSICKPESRTTGIYPSVMAFVLEVEAAVNPQTPTVDSRLRPVQSDRFEALSANERSEEVLQLAFATHGLEGTIYSEVQVCGSLCLTTDDPERLRKSIELVRNAVAKDPLVPAATKAKLTTASLEEIIQTPIARATALRQLSTTPFSAYLYYCHKKDFDDMSAEKRKQALLVMPLFHRLSKRKQHIERINSQIPEVLTLLAKARQRVVDTYKREPRLPAVGPAKFAPLEELASFVVSAGCDYLANQQDAVAAEIFENLRTRIRYAENVATGEKHLRDSNPLP